MEVSNEADKIMHFPVSSTQHQLFYPSGCISPSTQCLGDPPSLQRGHIQPACVLNSFLHEV